MGKRIKIEVTEQFINKGQKTRYSAARFTTCPVIRACKGIIPGAYELLAVGRKLYIKNKNYRNLAILPKKAEDWIEKADKEWNYNGRNSIKVPSKMKPIIFYAIMVE